MMLPIMDIDGTAASEVHSFKGYHLFLRNDGIIQLEFEPGFNGEIDDGRNIVNVIKKIKNSGKCLVMVTYAEDNTFTKETREYIASHEVSESIKADAMVIKGLALRIILNGYLKINKPKRPTRLFNSKQEALSWLKQLPD